VSEYLGCYKDVFAATERDLGGMVALEENRMTPTLCEDICGRRHQYRYFGLQVRTRAQSQSHRQAAGRLNMRRGDTR
jgi:hypothetical protein